MNCKKARRLIILDLYGELGERDTSRLHDHIRECRACADDLAVTKNVFTLLDENRPADTPAVDWEKAWNGIQSGLTRPSRERYPAPWAIPARRWAFVGAAAVIVLIAGILIGRYGFGPARQTALASAEQAALAPGRQPAPASPNGIRPLFASYLEDIKPILLDYAHYEPGEKNGRLISVDESVLRGLVLQNVLLKRKLAAKDPAAADLLDDIDLVLKEISSGQAQDRNSPAEIKNVIEQRDILFKLEILKKL